MLEYVQKYIIAKEEKIYQDNTFSKGSDCCEPCKLLLCIYKSICVYTYVGSVYTNVLIYKHNAFF